MEPWEAAGKAVVVLLVAFAFAYWSAKISEPAVMSLPLGLFAFSAVFTFCLGLYELAGRALGILGERLFGRTRGEADSA